MVEWESLTIKQLADLLQLNQETVRNWVNAGELEYLQVGRAKRIPRHAAIALAGGEGNEIPELMTVAQVAELLRVNKQTVRNWIIAGALPAMHIGRRVRIKTADLDRILATAASKRPSAEDFWLGTQPVGEAVRADDGSGP
jgi:excisionase family DNA binding protein